MGAVAYGGEYRDGLFINKFGLDRLEFSKQQIPVKHFLSVGEKMAQKSSS